MLGTIENIEEVNDFKIQPVAPIDGENGSRLGLGQMINMLGGYSDMEGYRVSTNKHTISVLIDDFQSCCESSGYLSSDDNLSAFVGADLLDIELTDTALKNIKVEEAIGTYGFDGGGIQFVNFNTNKGTFQLAVYNSHNGYYGHGILVAKDSELLLNKTL